MTFWKNKCKSLLSIHIGFKSPDEWDDALCKPKHVARFYKIIIISFFCVRSSSCRTDLSIHFQPTRPTTIWMFFLVTLRLSLSLFNYETEHRKCKIPLCGWHYGLRCVTLGRPLQTGLEPRSLACLACFPDTTVELIEYVLIKTTVHSFR